MVDDLALLEQWRSGDARAGQELFARYFADVYQFFQHKVGPEADDLVQRTFAACVASRDRFRGRSSFRTYVFSIARYQLYSYLRQLPRGDQADFELTSIAEVVTTIRTQLDRTQQAERLRRALAELPAEQQLLLELHYWHDLDAAALAEVFETAQGTIRVRLLRARNALREQIGQLDLDPASADHLVAALSQPDVD